jgi:hypothetical protein
MFGFVSCVEKIKIKKEIKKQQQKEQERQTKMLNLEFYQRTDLKFKTNQ